MDTESECVIEKGSGNVFADIGMPRPDEALAKAELVRRIAEIIASNGWTQVQAASALGLDQAKVSALLRGRLQGYSTDRLLRLLTRLGQEVDITVRPVTRRVGARIQVHCQS